MAASRQVCCPETEKAQCLATLAALHCPGGQEPQRIYLAGSDLHRKEPALRQDQWLVVTERSQQQLPLAPPQLFKKCPLLAFILVFSACPNHCSSPAAEKVTWQCLFP